MVTQDISQSKQTIVIENCKMITLSSACDDKTFETCYAEFKIILQEIHININYTHVLLYFVCVCSCKFPQLDICKLLFFWI